MTLKTNEKTRHMVSLQNTMFGDVKFTVFTSPIEDLSNKTVVGSGMTESVIAIADDDKQTARVVSAYAYRRTMQIDTDNSDVTAGTVLDLGDGDFIYVTKVDGSTVTFKTRLPKSIDADTDLKQAGNTSMYVSDEFSFDEDGHYLVTSECPEYGLVSQKRIIVQTESAGNDDSEVVAVAH